MKNTFYSNGKLLLTGEYLVLDGAKALAVPTKMGQNLVLENGIEQKINWTSFDADNSVWFQETIHFEDILNPKKSVEKNTSETLIYILHHAHLLNPDVLKKANGFVVETHLTFPRNWGLGTSSTLINNIAQWFQIDAFLLLKNSFGGSGYDIACAKYNSPIFYNLAKENPTIEIAHFNPKFTDDIYFVFLNKKQNSKLAIAYYNQNKKSSLNQNIEIINALTNEIATANDFHHFELALEKHEKIISEILSIPTVKSSLFSDFKGAIKSLGAWGGDFVLVTSKTDPKTYFNSKGYNTIIPYRNMIL